MGSRPPAQPDAAVRHGVEWPPSAETLKRVEILWLGQEPPPAEVEEAFTVIRPAEITGPPPPRSSAPPTEPAPVVIRAPQEPASAVPSPADAVAAPVADEPVAPPAPAAADERSFFIERPPSLIPEHAAARQPRSTERPRSTRRPRPGFQPARPRRWPAYATGAVVLVAAALIATPAFWRRAPAPNDVTLGTADAGNAPAPSPALPPAAPGLDVAGSTASASPPVAEARPDDADLGGDDEDRRADAGGLPEPTSRSSPAPAPDEPAARVASPPAPLPILAPASQVTSPTEVARGGRGAFEARTFEVAAVGGIPTAPAGAPAPAAAPAPRPAAPGPAEPVTPPVGTAAPESRVVDSAEAATTAEQGVRDALSRYRSGYEELNVGMVREAWPGVDTEALARAFSGLSSQDLVFDRCDILVRGDAAKARCAGSNTYVRRVGSRAPRTVPLTWAFDLSMRGNRWTITNAAVQ